MQSIQKSLQKGMPDPQRRAFERLSPANAPEEDVQGLVDEIGPYDMAVGLRTDDSYEPLVRQPGKFILSAFANFLAGVKIPDVNSGCRAFKRDVILRYLHLMPS
jgi:hypothetical protein